MHWCSHDHLQHLCHLVLPSASIRTYLYSVCARGWWLRQYLVRTACQEPRAMCDASPRAESISEVHSSLSLIGPEARAAKSENSRWGCYSRSCSGLVCRKPSIVFIIVLWAEAVRLSILYFQVDRCVPICPLYMGHLQKPLHESLSPEVCWLHKICPLYMLCSVLHPECT